MTSNKTKWKWKLGIAVGAIFAAIMLHPSDAMWIPFGFAGALLGIERWVRKSGEELADDAAGNKEEG